MTPNLLSPALGFTIFSRRSPFLASPTYLPRSSSTFDSFLTVLIYNDFSVVSIVYLVANVHPLVPFTFILQLQVLLYTWCGCLASLGLQEEF